jgi:hypothetical protein
VCVQYRSSSLVLSGSLCLFICAKLAFVCQPYCLYPRLEISFLTCKYLLALKLEDKMKERREERYKIYSGKQVWICRLSSTKWDERNLGTDLYEAGKDSSVVVVYTSGAHRAYARCAANQLDCL